jgi:type III pantothenate kinase
VALGREDQGFLGLSIGNSRLHWAWVRNATLQLTWDSDHIPPGTPLLTALQRLINLPESLQGCFPSPRDPAAPWPNLRLISVVPDQTKVWEEYPHRQKITLTDIPLASLYPSLGIDRALALWAAGEIYGWPVLVVDAGTALTLTGADQNHGLVGGAILPGLGLQLRCLAQFTAALPEVKLPSELPPRWAQTTPEAIQSGICYTTLAGVQDFLHHWGQRFPSSAVVITGGDRRFLMDHLRLSPPTVEAPHLILQGLALLQF